MERAKQVLIGDSREYTVEDEHGDTVWFAVDTDTWEKEKDRLRLCVSFALKRMQQFLWSTMRSKLIVHGTSPKVILVLRYGSIIIFMKTSLSQMMLPNMLRLRSM